MTKTQYQYELEMRNTIVKILDQVGPEGLNLDVLVGEMMLLFPVSEGCIRRFVDLRYIKTGRLYITDSLIRPRPKEAVDTP